MGDSCTEDDGLGGLPGLGISIDIAAKSGRAGPIELARGCGWELREGRLLVEDDLDDLRLLARSVDMKEKK